MMVLHTQLISLADELGWNRTQGSVFGLYKDYFFQIRSGWLASMTNTSSVADIDTGTRDILERELQTNRKSLGIRSLRTDKNGAIIQLKPVGIGIIGGKKRIKACLDFLIERYERLNIAGGDICHACGSPGDIQDYYFTNDDMAASYCGRCYRAGWQSLPSRRRLDPLSQRTYKARVLCSLKYAFVTALIIGVVSVFIRTGFTMIMGMVFPVWMAWAGYQAGQGKSGTWDRWIVIGIGAAALVTSVSFMVIAFQHSRGLSLVQIWEQIFLGGDFPAWFWGPMAFAFFINIPSWIYIYLKMLKVEKLAPLEPAIPMNEDDLERFTRAASPGLHPRKQQDTQPYK